MATYMRRIFRCLFSVIWSILLVSMRLSVSGQGEGKLHNSK